MGPLREGVVRARRVRFARRIVFQIGRIRQCVLVRTRKALCNVFGQRSVSDARSKCTGTSAGFIGVVEFQLLLPSSLHRPTFYHVEIKTKKPLGLWDSMLREYSWLAHFQQNSTKRHLYNDKLFFAAKPVHRPMSELGMERSTSYKRRMPLGCVLRSKYKCDQSIKFIISMMVTLGYKYVFLLGVDMYTADYFRSPTENKHLFEGMHLPNPTSERFKAHRSNASVHNNLNCKVPLFFNRLSKGCHQSFINLSPRSPLKRIMDTFHVNDLPADILQTCSSKGEGME